MLQGDVLPQYAAALRVSDTAGLIAVCLTMLSLPEDRGSQLDREKVQGELEECGKLLRPEAKGAKALVTMPTLQVRMGLREEVELGEWVVVGKASRINMSVLCRWLLRLENCRSNSDMQEGCGRTSTNSNK